MKLIKRKPEVYKIDLREEVVDFPGSDKDLKHYINVRINAEMAWRFHVDLETLTLFEDRFYIHEITSSSSSFEDGVVQIEPREIKGEELFNMITRTRITMLKNGHVGQDSKWA